MILLDGNAVSKRRLADLRIRIEERLHKDGQRPGLAVVRIGENSASKIYVGRKVKACEEAGIYSLEKHYPDSVTEDDVLKVISELNENPLIHGILIQLPLPKHISESRILTAVDPIKDVDGFHPLNQGRLFIGEPTFIACTPLGIMNLLKEYKIEIAGKRAAVIGRSRIVGRPIALLLDQAGATVTVIHSQTKNRQSILKNSEIIVAALGKPQFVKAEDLQAGVVIVDVGINRLDSGKIVGDVDFENAQKIASAISPVPGGVGPMTISSLLENTWKSFQESKR